MNTNDGINSETEQTGQLHIQFAKLLNKILTAVGDELFEDINERILEKCRLSSGQDHLVISEVIEDVVKLMAKKIELSAFLITMDVNKKDYRGLEQEIQKREAEIRYHFKVEQQQKLYEVELEDRVQELQEQLKDVTTKLRKCQVELNQLQQGKKDMAKKLERYKQKLYEMSREGNWRSAEKNSSDKLLHKASFNTKNKSRADPYLDNMSKSKQLIITKHKQGSKLFREKGRSRNDLGSRIICFESIKMKSQANDTCVPSKKSMSYHASKIMGNHQKSQLNNSINLGQSEKKRKLRFARQVTDVEEHKQRNSLYV